MPGHQVANGRDGVTFLGNRRSILTVAVHAIATGPRAELHSSAILAADLRPDRLESYFFVASGFIPMPSIMPLPIPMPSIALPSCIILPSIVMD